MCTKSCSWRVWIFFHAYYEGQSIFMKDNAKEINNIVKLEKYYIPTFHSLFHKSLHPLIHTLMHTYTYSTLTHTILTSHTPHTPGWPKSPQVRLLCWQRGILPLCTSRWQDKSLCKFNYVEEKQIWLTQLSAHCNYCEYSYKISLTGELTLLW